MNFVRLKALLIVLLCLSLSLLLACGSSSDSDSPVEEVPYNEKISNIIVGNSLIVFAAEVADNRFELLSVDPVTAVRKGISDPFSAKNGLRPVAISPDQTKIAYRADRDYDGIDELYSNLLDGTNEVLLTNAIGTSTTNNSGTTVHYNWQWTNDSSRIIFRSDPDDDGIFEIQSILSDGTDLLELSGDLAVSCFSSECWKMSSDGLYISFLVQSVDQTSQILQNIYAVLVDQTGFFKLNQTLNPNARIHDWQWSPDGSRIAYISQNIDEINQLYTVLPSATERVLLNNDSLVTGVEKFSWSPDSTRLAFTDDTSQAGVVRLFNDLVDATDRVELIDIQDVEAPIIVDWAWSPDSSRIAYRADQNIAGKVELFTIETDGDWHRKMNGVLLENTAIQDQWDWSPDSLYVSFYAEQETAVNLDEFYVSTADASSSNRVNLALASNTQLILSDKSWLNDSSRLIYQTSPDGVKVNAIYSVLPDGSNSIRLTEELTSEESMTSWFLIAPDNSRLLYLVSNTTAGRVGLHSSSITSNERISLSSTGIVSEAQWLVDSARVIYVETSVNASQELFSILNDGTGRVKLY